MVEKIFREVEDRKKWGEGKKNRPYDPRVIIDAVRNNAEWCQAMCAAHGHPGTFGARAWTSTRRTPLSYPDAVS